MSPYAIPPLFNPIFVIEIPTLKITYQKRFADVNDYYLYVFQVGDSIQYVHCNMLDGASGSQPSFKALLLSIPKN
jgi:hypothetical protein